MGGPEKRTGASTGRASGFIPPRPSPALQAFADAAAPFVLRLWEIEEVEVGEADRERLRAFRSVPALFVANHPSLAEPAVLYRALRREGVTFHLLTAWDTMLKFGQVSAWVLQRLGGYSVRRGRLDRAALETSQEILLRGERVLLFPEGQTYGLNDTLLPFQQGALLIGLRAARALAEREPGAALPLVPLAVKYVYNRPMVQEIGASLARLENALGLAGISPGRATTSPPHHLTNSPPRYSRLRSIAAAVVARIEAEQGITPEPEADLDSRIAALRARLVERLDAALNAKVPPDTDFPSMVQALANAYEDWLATRPGARDRQSGTEDRRPETRDQRPEPEDRGPRTGDRGPRTEDRCPLIRDWLRLKNFVAIRDDYVAEFPSAERYLDVLGRLEKEVLGKSRIRGPRRAVLRVGEALDLSRFVPAYRENRRQALEDLTSRAQAEIAALLKELRCRTRTL
jgi:hypothetical protein